MITSSPRPATTGHPAYSWTMPCVPESAGSARRLVSCALAAWGLGDLAEAAVLCVSELVANAVQHSGARVIRVTASRPADGRVRVAVEEKGHAVPAPRHPRPEEEHGRGLILVGALSDRWGNDTMRWGKRVWCELDGGDGPESGCDASGAGSGAGGRDGV